LKCFGQIGKKIFTLPKNTCETSNQGQVKIYGGHLPSGQDSGWKINTYGAFTLDIKSVLNENLGGMQF